MNGVWGRVPRGGLRCRLLPTVDVVAAIVLLGATAFTWLPRLNGPIDLRSDAAVYYVLGTSLAEGKGYRLLNEPGEIEATQYPPLLPALVAAHEWVAGTSDHVVVGQWLRRTFALIFAGYILAAYCVARRRLPVGWAFLAVFGVLVHPFTLWLSDTCYADIPFAFASTMFVYFLDRQASAVCRVLAGMWAVASYLLRTIGIALLFAWIIEALCRRQWRSAAIRVVVAAVPLIVWHTHIARVERSSAYTNPTYPYQRAAYMFYNVSYTRNAALKEPFHPERGLATAADLGKRILRNVLEIPSSLGAAVSTPRGYWELVNKRLAALPLIPPIPGPVIQAGLLLLGAMTVVGLVVLAHQHDRVVPLYVALYIAIVSVTPWPWPLLRYWAAAAPFVSLPFVAALRALVQWVRFRDAAIRWAGSATITAVISGIVVCQLLVARWVFAMDHQRVEYAAPSGEPVVYRLFYYKVSHRALDSGLDWLKDRTDPNVIIAGSMPQYVYLRTGRRAVMPPFEGDMSDAASLLDAVPVSYVMLDGTGVDLARRYVEPLLRRATEQWTPVHAIREGDLVIYRRVR